MDVIDVHTMLWLFYSLVSVRTILSWVVQSQRQKSDRSFDRPQMWQMKIHQTNQFNKPILYYYSINRINCIRQWSPMNCKITADVLASRAHIHTEELVKIVAYFSYITVIQIPFYYCRLRDDNKTKHSRKFDNCSCRTDTHTHIWGGNTYQQYKTGNV